MYAHIKAVLLYWMQLSSSHFHVFLPTFESGGYPGPSVPCCGKTLCIVCSHKFTHLYQNHETWLNSWVHSSISDGDVTTLLHTLINFNPCCIQPYKSHVHRSHAGFRRYEVTKTQNMINFTGFSSQCNGDVTCTIRWESTETDYLVQVQCRLGF